jgi:hypothetical protein
VLTARAYALTVAVCGVLPSLAGAQPHVAIALPPASARTTDGPIVTLSDVFTDRRGAETIAAGFPGRITVVVELWERRRWFDERVGIAQWRRVVRFDAYTKTFRVSVANGETLVEEGQYADLDAVRRAIATPLRIALPAPPGRRGLYYTAAATTEVLNSNDLAEVQRWLRGIREPAAPTFLSGLWTIASRLLGGDTQHAEGYSGRFDTAR